MSPHFSSFTPEAMHAFGQELAAEHEQRRELLAMNRSQTQTLLANARRERCETEAQRRDQAAQEADARRLFMSELRSGVHALRNRFELARRDMATDFHQMADELRAAREAFRHRPGSMNAAARRAFRPAEPPRATQPPGPQTEADEPEASATAPLYEQATLTTPGEPMATMAAPQDEHPPAARPRHTSSEKAGPAKKRRG